MRTVIVAAVIGLVASLIGTRPAKSDEAGAGVPLLKKDMKNWSRIGPGNNPWRLTTADTLICEAAADRYVYEDVFADGTLHVEWRFRPTGDPKKVSSASVTVRGTRGEESCKVALGKGCGTISATAQSSSDRVKTSEVPASAKLRPADEWNAMDVQLAGKRVAVTVNGTPAASFNGGPAGPGLFSLNAEGDAVEFRNIRWKAK